MTGAEYALLVGTILWAVLIWHLWCHERWPFDPPGAGPVSAVDLDGQRRRDATRYQRKEAR